VSASVSGHLRPLKSLKNRHLERRNKRGDAGRIRSLAAGSWLGVGNDPVYAKSKCFDPFPFPDPTEAQKTRLRSLGEQLDAHRKAQQATHPKLTLTQMYNVLEKLRAGERIEGKDKEIYDQGLVGILREA
jgi:hypothetical protein